MVSVAWEVGSVVVNVWDVVRVLLRNAKRSTPVL